MVVEVPKDLVQRKSKSINECLREVVALGLARSAALGTFPTEAERAVDLYDEDPPIWYYDRRPPVINERSCDHERKWHKGVANSLGIPISNCTSDCCVARKHWPDSNPVDAALLRSDTGQRAKNDNALMTGAAPHQGTEFVR